MLDLHCMGKPSPKEGPQPTMRHPNEDTEICAQCRRPQGYTGWDHFFVVVPYQVSLSLSSDVLVRVILRPSALSELRLSLSRNWGAFGGARAPILRRERPQGNFEEYR